jgi:hypothetical protein
VTRCSSRSTCSSALHITDQLAFTARERSASGNSPSTCGLSSPLIWLASSTIRCCASLDSECLTDSLFSGAPTGCACAKDPSPPALLWGRCSPGAIFPNAARAPASVRPSRHCCTSALRTVGSGRLTIGTRHVVGEGSFLLTDFSLGSSLIAWTM